MSPRLLIALVLAASCLGFGFAAAATYDFAAHLDRQVHNLHCSFIPGMSSSSPAGAEGCQVTLMSPYSSLFRQTLWGGLPVSLLAMAVFAALSALSGAILLLYAEHERAALSSLLLLASIPVAASLVMGGIAAFKLHVACKQCIGIYLSSAVVGACAYLAQRQSSLSIHTPPRAAANLWLYSLPLAALLLVVLTTSYVLAMPQYEHVSGHCGTLTHADDPHGIFIHLPAQKPGAHKAIEIFDPLCPACRAFEERLVTSGLDQRLERDLLLFPLDKSCNWMVDTTMHPGSCAISGAVLCAGTRAKEVIDWAFASQHELEREALAHPDAPARKLSQRFPELASCMGSALTKARLSQSLRWAVKNRLPVLTPQLYVDGKRLCDEDTDLGLEYTLAHMLEKFRPMKAAIVAVALAAFVIPTGLVLRWVGGARQRLQAAELAPSDADAVAIAAAADEDYCTAQLKLVLRRVLKSCGLLSTGEVRGCQPTDAKQVATLAGGDFNALFLPMAERAGVVEFEQNSAALDSGAKGLVDKLFADQRGASYFFVVARASPEGAVEHNRELSKQRAEAVMSYLREKYRDPELDREVGLLWLGEEFAQLDQRFCEWQRSGAAEGCKRESLNRSAFMSWIDCQL